MDTASYSIGSAPAGRYASLCDAPGSAEGSRRQTADLVLVRRSRPRTPAFRQRRQVEPIQFPEHGAAQSAQRRALLGVARPAADAHFGSRLSTDFEVRLPLSFLVLPLPQSYPVCHTGLLIIATISPDRRAVSGIPITGYQGKIGFVWPNRLIRE
jgi:hypothetical protein